MAPSKSLKDQLNRFLRRMQSGGRAPPEDAHRWFNRGAHHVSLNEDENRDYEKVTSLLLSELAPGAEISEGTVLQHLNEAIFESRSPLALDLQGRIAFAATRLFDGLQRAVRKWQVHFPVVGFYEECLPMTIGLVTFFPAAESLSAMVVSADEPDTDGFRSLIRKFARKQIEEHFGNGQWARVTVHALERDAEAAKDLALAELELTLDVINFFADIYRPMQYRCRAELASDLRGRVRTSCAVMEGSEASGVGQAVIGPYDGVWLPPVDSVEARERGLARANAILSTGNRNEVEQRLLAALRWGGRGTAAERLPDRFLSYMMAFEALVNGPTKSDRIARTVESRAAQLLAEDNATSRRDREIERLYDLRSRLVHTGWAEISEDDVMNAWYCAKECTVRILVGESFAKVRTNAELDGWFAPLHASAP